MAESYRFYGFSGIDTVVVVCAADGGRSRIIDLLEQIDAVNQMIVIHIGDSFMQEQYV